MPEPETNPYQVSEQSRAGAELAPTRDDFWTAKRLVMLFFVPPIFPFIGFTISRLTHSDFLGVLSLFGTLAFSIVVVGILTSAICRKDDSANWASFVGMVVIWLIAQAVVVIPAIFFALIICSGASLTD